MRDKERTARSDRTLRWVCYKKNNERLGSHTFILTAQRRGARGRQKAP